MHYRGYRAKTKPGDRGPVYNLLRRAYRFLKVRVLYDTLLYPYGMIRHASLLRSAERRQSHAYTRFLRSPAQLQALTGPAVEFVLGNDREKKRLSILLFASSNGAEAYTIASTLMSAIPDVDFHVVASDLDQKLLEVGIAARYSEDEVLRSPHITEEFVRATLDKDADAYVVKAEIRDRVHFKQADVLDEALKGQFEAADIVFAQNVLFHLDPRAARNAFDNIATLLKPRAALFIDGMDLGLKEELTRKHNLKPLEYRLREIYEQSRTHVSLAWWNFYYGAEPYTPLRRNRSRRYSTIFLKDDAWLTAGGH